MDAGPETGTPWTDQLVSRGQVRRAFLIIFRVRTAYVLLATVCATVFAAAPGAKTQLATLLYAADAHNSKLTVFVGSAAALVLTSLLGVLAGTFISQHVSPTALSWVAGLGFIAIGAWTILRA